MRINKETRSDMAVSERDMKSIGSKLSSIDFFINYIIVDFKNKAETLFFISVLF